MKKFWFEAAFLGHANLAMPNCAHFCQRQKLGAQKAWGKIAVFFALRKSLWSG
jgi:hypothetical protein